MSHNTPKQSPLSPDVRKQVQEKQLGFIAHLLDGVWDSMRNNAIMAIGVGGACWFINEDFAPVLIPATAALGIFNAAAGGVSKWAAAKESAELYESPQFQKHLRQVEATARGVVASQHGTAWIVKEPGQAELKVMNEREYARYKREVGARDLALDEVRISARRVDVSRYVGGRLDSDNRDVPAQESFDLDSRKRTFSGWFSKGKPVAAPEGDHYRASRYLAGGSGHEAPAAGPRFARRPAYSASRFLSTGSGQEPEAEAGLTPAFGR